MFNNEYDKEIRKSRLIVKLFQVLINNTFNNIEQKCKRRFTCANIKT